MIIHMDGRGFTMVELIIIIAVMGILLVFSVVNLGDSQANGRDSERKADVETISYHLESFYKSGEDISTVIGRYPSIAINASSTVMKRMLRDIDTKSITAPGITDPTSTFIASTNSGVITQTTAAVLPQPTKDQYVYQPIQADGTLCTLETQDCRKYNIYYKLEVATTDCPAPDNLCMLTSKNQ